jgi:hypothetical protein
LKQTGIQKLSSATSAVQRNIKIKRPLNAGAGLSVTERPCWNISRPTTKGPAVSTIFIGERHNNKLTGMSGQAGVITLITHEEIIELGKKYGFSEAVLGYSDTEKMLLIFAMQIYARGYNDAIKTERELEFLDIFATSDGICC